MDVKLECGCIARNNYDDSTGCKFSGKISKGCNRMDYNPVVKQKGIIEENYVEQSNKEK